MSVPSSCLQPAACRDQSLGRQITHQALPFTRERSSHSGNKGEKKKKNAVVTHQERYAAGLGGKTDGFITSTSLCQGLDKVLTVLALTE